MALVKLYNATEVGQLRVAGFISGSGTNLVKILEHEQKLNRERGALCPDKNPEGGLYQRGDKELVFS